MPSSKHRKRQLAANRRQLEKARKKLQLQNLRAQENEKENQVVDDSRRLDDINSEEESSWLGGLGSLYSWCQSGLVQVRMYLINQATSCIIMINHSIDEQ